MKNFRLSPEAMIMIAGSSKGTQPKYFEDGYWYKANTNGYEGLAEYLAGIVLKHSNVSSEYRCAPIFDNGDSLLSSYMKYPPDVSTEENMEHVVVVLFRPVCMPRRKRRVFL